MVLKAGELWAYLKALFNGWVGWVSNILTLLSLLAGLLEPTWLPRFLSSIPRPYYIVFAFLSFGFANFRIAAKYTRPRLSIKVMNSDAYVRETYFSPEWRALEGHKDSFQLVTQARVRVANNAPAGSVYVTVLGMRPAVCYSSQLASNWDPSSVKLATFFSEEKFENPCYMQPGQIIPDLEVTVEFSVPVEHVEKNFGSLSAFDSLTVSYAFNTAGGPPERVKVAFDMSHVRERLERDLSAASGEQRDNAAGLAG